MSEEIKKLISIITKEVGIEGKIPGKLFNIEQHTDGVVTEFSINYVREEEIYVRYFIIKEVNKNKKVNVHYMGSEITKENPKTNLFFKPEEQLVAEQNQDKFEEIIKFVQENTKIGINTNTIVDIWDRKYPDGFYDVIYIGKKTKEIIIYVVSNDERKIVKIVKG